MSKQTRKYRSVILKRDPSPILIPRPLMGPITEKKTAFGIIYENIRERRRQAKAKAAQTPEPSKNGSE